MQLVFFSFVMLFANCQTSSICILNDWETVQCRLLMNKDWKIIIKDLESVANGGGHKKF